MLNQYSFNECDSNQNPDFDDYNFILTLISVYCAQKCRECPNCQNFDPKIRRAYKKFLLVSRLYQRRKEPILSYGSKYYEKKNSGCKGLKSKSCPILEMNRRKFDQIKYGEQNYVSLSEPYIVIFFFIQKRFNL